MFIGPQKYHQCVASKLWEKTSDRFKETNLITVAKKEAQSLAEKLPF